MNLVIGRAVRSHLVLLILFFSCAVLAVTSPSFLTLTNISNILKNWTIIGIISCGLTLVIVGGDLDLSVGSALSLLGVLSVTMQQRGIVYAVAIPIAAAIFIGLFNGLIPSLVDVNSIIVTLGSLSILGGLALLASKGAVVLAVPDKYYSFLGSETLLGIPVYICVFVLVAACCEILLRQTSFGKALVFVGTNREAAVIAGINVVYVRTMAFVICSILVAVAGIMLSSRMTSASPLAGIGYEFSAITAIVIGGVSLKGGKGSIYNTVIGVVLLGVITNALNLFNVSFAFQNIAKGALIMVALYADAKSRQGILR